MFKGLELVIESCVNYVKSNAASRSCVYMCRRRRDMFSKSARFDVNGFQSHSMKHIKY